MAKTKLPSDRYQLQNAEGKRVTAQLHVGEAEAHVYFTFSWDDAAEGDVASLDSAPVVIPDFRVDTSRFLAIYKPGAVDRASVSRNGTQAVLVSAHPHQFHGEDANVYAFDYAPLDEAPWFAPRISLVHVSDLYVRDVLGQALSESSDAVGAAHTQAREAVARLRSLQKELAAIQQELRTYKSGAELALQGLDARVKYAEARSELLYQQQNLFRHALAAYASEESWTGDSKNILVNGVNGFATAVNALNNVVAGEIP